jgi:hypothetical protein
MRRICVALAFAVASARLIFTMPVAAQEPPAAPLEASPTEMPAAAPPAVPPVAAPVAAPPEALPPAPPSWPAPTERKRYRDKIEVGIGPMVLANVHWLDAPGDRHVSAGGVSGIDGVYPGFVGTDLSVGFMADARFFDVIGVEVDLLRQNDRGSGTVSFDNQGIPCIIRQNGGPVTVPGPVYTLTIGQGAWHLPFLAKLSIPKRERWRDEDGEREVTVRSATLGLGPEVVFPDHAELAVSPDGLCYPQRAVASPYVMYTAALGFEWRLLRSFDLRLTGSLRASFNPGPGDSVDRRGEYALVGSEVQPLSYRSEWRYQLAMTLSLGVFF